MKIEVWSDYVCPYCYLGKRRLENAIEATGYADQIKVEFKSFQLDPMASTEQDEPIYAALARKFNASQEEIRQMTAAITAQAAQVGLNYQFDHMVTANTLAAHRLAKLAEAEGKSDRYNEQMMKAYFEDGQAIGQMAVLQEIAQQVGLDSHRVHEVLTTAQYEEQVEQEMEMAQKMRINGVPFFVINRKYGISGAQPQRTFEQAITQVAHEMGLTKTSTS